MEPAYCFRRSEKGINRIILAFIGLLFVAATAYGAGDASAPVTVSLFSPQGEIKGVRQAAARFSEEMVSFGSPVLEDPFTVNCPARGKGRWADGRNWVYDFDKDIKAGLTCTFTLKSGIKALSGRDVTGRRAFSFSTGGPQVVSVMPAGGREGIVEDQAFVLTLDGDVREDSVAKNVFCYLSETKEKVGVRVVGGKEADAITKAAPARRRYRAIPRDGGDKDVSRIVVQCVRPFSNNATVDLIWGKGVVSTSGIPSSHEQVFHYKTRPPFTATFHCGRDNPKAQCNPFLPVSIDFSSEVPRDVAARITMKLGRKVYRPRVPGNSERVSAVTIDGPFREKSVFTISLPRDIRDDDGRRLLNSSAYPLTARTDAYPPLAKFSSRFGIIEQSEPVLPVTVRNIGPYLRGRIESVPDQKAAEPEKAGKPAAAPEKEGDGAARTGGAVSEGASGAKYVTDLGATIKTVGGDVEVIEWLRKVANVGRTRSLLKAEASAKKLAMPRPLGQKAFEVMGIPFKKPGLYVVELESTILGASYLREKTPMYVHTAALVTNLSAHFKKGRESSVVWVTSLDKGEPVEGATVAIRDCLGKLLWEGRTDGSGIARIDTRLPDAGRIQTKEDRDAHYDWSQIQPIGFIDSGYFVFARKSGDMTFVHSSWDKGIESYRFKLPYGYDYWYGGSEHEPSRLVIRTVFDRTLFRAGETVHMKHVARRPTKDGFAIDERLPASVTIRHSGSDEKYSFPLSWDAAKGIAETTWQIPRDAKLGSYQVQMETGRRRFEAGSFKVQQFKLPIMKAAVKPVSDRLVNTTKVDVDVMAEYLSGGGARGLPVKVRAQAVPKEVAFEDQDRYYFSRGAVREGIKRREADSGYSEEPEDAWEEPGFAPRRHQGGQRKSIKTVDLTLGEGGMARTTIDGVPRASFPIDLITEMEFKDPSGRVVTASRTIPVWPAKVILGLQMDESFTRKGPVRMKALALDLSGKPMAGVQVGIAVYQKNYYSHRKKLVGGFYAYENGTEIKKTDMRCAGTTNAQGLVFCEIKKPQAGSFVIEARAADEAGNVAATNSEIWVAGAEELWFDASSSDRIDLIPDKQHYEPGDKALFQVRMPMREATALITVEREGIIDSFVTKLSGTNPSVEVPIKGAYAPNVFVSALCVRGRAGAGKPTAYIDLAKPTYKLGIAGVSVGWKEHELRVDVAPDKKVYKIREKARFKVRVRTADGRPLPAGSEVAFAVVDDSLLELMPNESWKLLEHMMQKRPYGVQTSTAQMQVVGRRHYGLKAIPFGGGGGRQITRELFDTLILWKGRLALDENGEASVEATLNDALTSFSAVAVATAGTGLFGTGRTHIQSTQDLMLLSGLSDVVREGDRFKAVFTVRNTTDRDITAEAKARITDERGVRELPDLKEGLKPGEAREVSWEVTVPAGVGTMKWEVEAADLAGTGRDSVRVTQKVAPLLVPRVVQATIAQLDGTMRLSVEKPREASPAKGGVRVSLAPRLAGELSGVADYMGSYPYSCLEQRVSKAVALQDKTAWQAIMKVLPGYMDNDGLLKYFPPMDKGDETLTAYVVAVSHEAGLEIPINLLRGLGQGLRKFVEGGVRSDSPVARPDLTIRKLAAIEALSRLKMARASHLQSIEIQPPLWPTSAVLDWTNILKRLPDVPGREKRLEEARQIIRSRLNFQGTRMGFSTEQNDYLWWLMINGDVNAVRTVLTFLDDPAWKEDMPRLVTGAVQRQQKGRWSSTPANAWGSLALTKFSDAFEAVKVNGVTDAKLGRQKHSLDWKEAPAGKLLMFSWPAGSEKLMVRHDGAGKPWVAIQGLAAVPLKEAVSTGFKVKKSYTAVDRKKPGKWSIGDVVRVRLELEAQGDMTWVVVNDPIPAGCAILGTGLGGESSIMTAGEKREGWARPAYEERSFEAYKAYYRYVRKGKWLVEYRLRVNTSGVFLLPETRVEALYAPEMFGETPNGPFSVE